VAVHGRAVLGAKDPALLSPVNENDAGRSPAQEQFAMGDKLIRSNNDARSINNAFTSCQSMDSSPSLVAVANLSVLVHQVVQGLLAQQRSGSGQDPHIVPGPSASRRATGGGPTGP
jgi:hypothetical protein